MKRSALGLIYLIQGMRNAGIDVDSRLADIGIKVDSLTQAQQFMTVWNGIYSKLLVRMLTQRKDYLLDNITHWQVMVLTHVTCDQP